MRARDRRRRGDGDHDGRDNGGALHPHSEATGSAGRAIRAVSCARGTARPALGGRARTHGRRPARGRRGPRRTRPRTRGDPGRRGSRRSGRPAPRRARRGPAPNASPGAERHGRDRPHEPRPRAAVHRLRSSTPLDAGRGYSNLEYDLAEGAAWLAAGSRRGDPAPADRRRGAHSSSTTTRRRCCSRSPRSPKAARCSSRAAS